ncbi:hypothetical protein [Curtobacterium sp. MCBD17_032]|uniref:hypothetical protein n=1 Tax=Curtobacterium sp. MCBD17_032 TaxID=2175659 RepID=UPI000DA75D55|nr:hypothetical protein [Curtobacterium sp. MCBD17_032]PZE87146.1 hypothetical protein DEI91_02320 [Curtobacterium sp. MCBD17_032]
MSMSSAFDPSKGRAIPEDQVSSDGLELDEDPAALGIRFDVVSGGSTDPAAAPVLRGRGGAGSGAAEAAARASDEQR